MMLHGLQIFTDPNMQDRVPYPRSPARAKRRAAMGHPQHYRWVPSRQIYRKGDSLYMHPAMLAELRRDLKDRGIDNA